MKIEKKVEFDREEVEELIVKRAEEMLGHAPAGHHWIAYSQYSQWFATTTKDEVQKDTPESA